MLRQTASIEEAVRHKLTSQSVSLPANVAMSAAPRKGGS